MNLYASSGMTQSHCIELLISTDRAIEVTEEIMEVAHTGVDGDGTISIEKIDDDLERIRNTISRKTL